MKAKKIILETDRYGRLLHQPHLPPNIHIETIFLIPQDEKTDKRRRKPSAKIMGKGRITGNIVSPVVPLDDWDALKKYSVCKRAF